MIRILVADDHAIVRRGLVEVVSEAYDMEVTAEAATGDEVLGLAVRQEFDVVVLDISMPGRSGLDALAQLRRVRPELAVLVLSVHPEEQYALRVLRMGAAGYVCKDRAPEELVRAIRTVARGRRHVPAGVAEAAVAGDATVAAHDRLSPREFEVLRLLGSGKAVGGIAAELNLSVKTVSTYRARLLEKMRMETTAELIRYAVEHEIVA